VIGRGSIPTRAARAQRGPHPASPATRSIVSSDGPPGSTRRASIEQCRSVIAKIATKVVNAAYQAFGSGLHVALDISGALVLIGAIVSLSTIHGRRGAPHAAAKTPR
jgi:hypothetical protein